MAVQTLEDMLGHVSCHVGCIYFQKKKIVDKKRMTSKDKKLHLNVKCHKWLR